MTRAALYSKPLRAKRSAVSSAQPDEPPAPTPSAPPKPSFFRRFERPLMFASMVAATLVALGIYAFVGPQQKIFTQRDIDAAVAYTLEKKKPEPSFAAAAYGAIAPSVVLVRRLGHGADDDKNKKFKTPKKKPPPADKAENKKPEKGGKDELEGVGTGVVVSEDGLIFTCLHVVAGAEKVNVVFTDGTESDVELMTAQPENDLAVLKAKTLPDDLVAATLRSTQGLNVGDEVVAVGFPFGVGPTATSGVVSGLRREHFSEEGQRNLVDLIQFDAAANPGNSGGPLVTRDGEVVGIVTSILNPTDQGFFVGIAFAVPIENAATAAGLSPF